jgi:hypothetical protein
VSAPVCVVPEGFFALVGVKLTLTLQVSFGASNEPQWFAISWNGPLIETDWMLSAVRPGFETASALADERIPALTRPNATDAGLTLNAAAAIADPHTAPTMTSTRAATSGNLAISRVFFTTTDHNSLQPETNRVFHRPAPSSRGPAAACVECNRAISKPSITDCKKCLHFVGSFPAGDVTRAVNASHGRRFEFQICNLMLHFLYR